MMVVYYPENLSGSSVSPGDLAHSPCKTQINKIPVPE